MGTPSNKPTPFVLTREEEFLLAASEAPTPHDIGVEEGFDWRELTGFSEKEKNTFLNQYLLDGTCDSVSFSSGHAVLSAKGKQRAASIKLKFKARRKPAQPMPPATQDVKTGMPEGKAEPAAPRPQQCLTDQPMTQEQKELWRLEREAEEQARFEDLLIACYDASLETHSPDFNLNEAATKAGFANKDEASRYFVAMHEKGLIRLFTRGSAAMTDEGKTAVRAIRSGRKQQPIPPAPSEPLLPTSTTSKPFESGVDSTPPSKGRLHWLWGVTDHQVVGGLIVALVIGLVGLGLAHTRGCFDTKPSRWTPTQQSSQNLSTTRPAEVTPSSPSPHSKVQGAATKPTTNP